MYPKKGDLAYFNTPKLWFAGLITMVYGPCVVCERYGSQLLHEENSALQVVPKGPYYRVLIRANGYTYEAILFEHDRALGGWLIASVNGESSQLQQVLEWTYYLGPPHSITHTLETHPWVSMDHVLGARKAFLEAPPHALWKGHDTGRAVSASDATGYTGA